MIAWQWPLVFSTNKLTYGDFDYFTQAYEAIRLSILHFHQFPWVNVWVGGGVPLYANPQIGVFSLQTMLVLIFGAPYGLKLSIVAYSLIGYWGMFLLVRKNMKARLVPALAISSIWITNGFFVGHLVGHYSFSMFLVFPGLLYLLLNVRRRYYWAYLGVALALYILSAFHYAVFQGFLILGLVGFADMWCNRKNLRHDLMLYTKAGLLFLLIAGHRIFYSIQFALDFPRLFKEEPNQILTILKAFVIPGESRGLPYSLVTPGKIVYGWIEYSAFVGYVFCLLVIVTIIVVLVQTILYSRSKKATRNDFSRIKLPLLFTGLLALCVIIGIGNFAPYSPYALLGKIPTFSGMRVPSRWLIWAILSGLLLITSMSNRIRSRRLSTLFVMCIVLGAGEVYCVGFGNDRFNNKPLIFRSSSSAFEQFVDFDRQNPPHSFSSWSIRPTFDRKSEIYSYESTLNNLGEARGYEPVVDTYYEPTARCGVVQGCQFIQSNNAKLVSWSPNKIVIQRTGSGSIELDMNPSNYWLVNGSRIFGDDRTVEVLKHFTINDPSGLITVQASPRIIPSVLLNKTR